MLDQGTTVEEMLDAVDAEIEQARAAKDRYALERLAARLETAGQELGDEGRGLIVAAARARAALPALPATPIPEDVPVLPAAPPPLAYAGWGRRVTAFVVDWIVIWIALGVLTAAVGGRGLAPVLLVPFVYFTVLHGTTGRTLGKLLLGTAVRRQHGASIETGTAFVRVLAQGVLIVIPLGFFVDSLWPLWDARRQSLHDKVAGTVVVRVR
jgi:uncharacterized RDD family membrane protein YckC